jgi:aspartate-semialdehyde dehydrogenase
MKLAVIGATGVVGQVMLKVLEERKFPVSELIIAASGQSVGKSLKFAGKAINLVSVADAIASKPSLALFSAGAEASEKYAPLFADYGCYVVDNSSFWRMDAAVPLVVPEINKNLLNSRQRIISNPNCSTIQLVVVLNPLYKKYGIRRVVISTYQSVTGTGQKAVKQLKSERAGWKAERAYPHPIDLNLIPHGGKFLDDGYTTEEEKLVNETRKIMNAPEIMLTATVVRVPVFGGHSESVNVELARDYDLIEVRRLLSLEPGIQLLDDPAANLYPMPLMAEGKDDVFVGRIRRDFSQANSLNLWIVSDNLRKGAATNAIQIAEALLEKKLINQ